MTRRHAAGLAFAAHLLVLAPVAGEERRPPALFAGHRRNRMTAGEPAAPAAARC